MMDDLENLFYENNERLQIIYEDELSIGNLLFEGKGKLNPQPDDDAPIDTVECNGERYCLKMSPFESWGILVEVQNECNFFYNDTAEMDLLQHRKFKKILLFIPLKEKGTGQ